MPSLARDGLLRRGPGQDVQELEHEAVHLRRPALAAVDEEVIGHDRRNGRAEARRRGDQGLGNARGDHGEIGGALLADVVEGAHDADDGAEETDEGRGARRGGKKGQIALHASHFRVAHPSHRPMDGIQRLARQPLALFERRIHRLHAAVDAGQLMAGRRVERGQRAPPEALRGRVEQREAAALAKGLREGPRLALDGAELPELLDDERPADDREEEQDSEDEAREGTGREYRVEDARGQARGTWQSGLLLWTMSEAY